MNNEALGELFEIIKSFTNVEEVIFADQKGKKPKYPYITMKIIALGDNTGMGIYLYNPVPSEHANFEYDLEEKKIEMPKSTVSVNVYAKTWTEAEHVALECSNWFNFYGYEALKEKNIVVVNTTSIENRDALINRDYERRRGFDVFLRVTSEMKQIIGTIESAEINKKE